MTDEDYNGGSVITVRKVHGKDIEYKENIVSLLNVLKELKRSEVFYAKVLDMPGDHTWVYVVAPGLNDEDMALIEDLKLAELVLPPVKNGPNSFTMDSKMVKKLNYKKYTYEWAIQQLSEEERWPADPH